MNTVQFEQLLTSLQSANNEERKKGEDLLEQLKTNADLYIGLLITTLVNNGPTSVPANRQLACTMLSRDLIIEHPIPGAASSSAATATADNDDKGARSTFWSRLSASTRADVVQGLTTALTSESARAVQRQLYELVPEVYQHLDENGEATKLWGNLLPTLFTMASSSAEHLRVGGLEVFAQLTLMTGCEAFRSHLPMVEKLVSGALAEGESFAVRLAGVRATVSLLECMEKEDERKLSNMRGLLPGMLAVVEGAIRASLEDEANEALESLVDLAEEKPVVFRASLEPVVAGMLAIVRGKGMPEATARLALELLVTLCEKRPGMMKKAPGVVGALLDVQLEWMARVDDVARWDEFEDGDEDTTNADVAESTLDRFCNALHGQTVVPELFRRIGILLGSPQWKHRHAGLMAITICGEGCAKSLRPLLGEVLPKVLAFTHDEHPRVRWAAYNTVGQLCQDFGPRIQREHGDAIVAAITAGMADANRRVAGHATSCILNFADTADAALLTAKYADTLLAALRGVCGIPALKVQETLISALDVLIHAIGGAFAPHYDAFVPHLKGLVQRARGKDERLLRGLAIESLSVIGTAVGRDRFAQDARDVMAEIMATQLTDPDDPQVAYIESAFGFFAELLGAEFAQYLPNVLPATLARAQQKGDIEVLGDDPDLDGDGDDDERREGWETMIVGGTYVSVHTSQHEDKANATNVLAKYARALGSAVLPYAEQMLAAALKNSHFIYSEDVRSAAYLALPDIVSALIAGVREGKAKPESLRGALDMVLGSYIKHLPEEDDLTVKLAAFTALKDVVTQVSEPFLDDVRMKAAAAFFQAQYTLWVEQRNALNKARTEEDYDDELEDDIVRVKEDDAELLNEMTEALCAIIRIHGAAFAPHYTQNLHPIFSGLVQATRDTDEITHAICVFDEILEHVPALALPNAHDFLQLLAPYAASAAPDVRQSAAYGLGVAAKTLGDAYLPYLPKVLGVLTADVTEKDAFAEDGVMCEANENALSAIGKILLAFGQQKTPGFADVLRTFVEHLPIRLDTVEAKISVHVLCHFIKEVPELVFGGQSFANGNIVMTAFAEAVAAENVDPEDAKEIRAVVAQLLTRVPPETLFAGLPQPLVAVFQKFLNQTN